MPYIPRKFAQSSGVPAEFQQPPQDKPPLPTKEQKTEDKQDARHRLGMSMLSMKNFKMPVTRVCKILFGKEPNVHDATGQLVLDRSP